MNTTLEQQGEGNNISKGMLLLSGYFATRPLQTNFDLAFQSIDGQWRLYGIAVATPEAKVAEAAAPKPAKPGGAR